MAPRDAPDHVDWVTVAISLKDENARSLRVARIIFDDNRGRRAIDDLTCENVVFCHLIISVRRDPDLAALDEIDDPT
jgi:hypothetical protein